MKYLFATHDLAYVRAVGVIDADSDEEATAIVVESIRPAPHEKLLIFALGETEPMLAAPQPEKKKGK